jgi:SRSO17 transposase
MVEPRAPVNTVTFIDNYCAVYRDLFSDVRSFEAFKHLHLGMALLHKKADGLTW